MTTKYTSIVKSEKKRNPLFLLGFVALFAIPILLLGTRLSGNDFAPDDSSAIYGGKVENNAYPYAGYVIANDQNNRSNICGTVYLSSNFALTAAHCFAGEGVNAYLGYSRFSFNLDQNFLAQDVFIHPGWDGKQSKFDIAMIKLPDGFYEVEEYAEITSPKVGCDYEVIGYGNTEDSSSTSKLNRLRKSAEMCITKIDKNVIEVKGANGGVCFGDSGSPLFVKGTNKLVGVLSAIVPDPNSNGDPCFVGNTALIVRLDTNSEFDYFKKENFDINQYSSCGESCAGKACLTGLTCINGLCLSDDGNQTCKATEGQFCSVFAGLGCEGTSVCSFNKCNGNEDVIQSRETLLSTLGIDGDESDGLFNSKDGIFVILIAASIVLWMIIAKVIISNRSGKGDDTPPPQVDQGMDEFDQKAKSFLDN